MQFSIHKEIIHLKSQIYWVHLMELGSDQF